VFLICDEITSGLDAAIQGQILQVLLELHRTLGMTLLLISHDLNTVRYMASHVVVMDGGIIVEQDSVDQIFMHPQHQVTRQLLAAKV
jgi:ABC-type dipeptide/oligopeptide/nickel transport system ATPase component